MRKATYPVTKIYPRSTASPATITAAELRGKAFEPVRWVVPDLIPEGLTILAGKPKLGKSWLALDVALAASRGGFTLGDRACIRGDVLYAALEDGQRRLKSRMEMVSTSGAEWPETLAFATELPGLESGGMDALRAWTASAKDPRLIIIDTFAKVRPGKARDETQYESDYRAAGMLKALADELRIGVVIVHHVRKMEAEDPFDTVSGTNGLTGAADTILVLQRGASGVTLFGRGRDIEEQELAVEFDRRFCRWSVLGDAGEVRASDERKAIIDALKLAADPMSPTELANVTGHPYGATRKLLFNMTRDDEVKRVGRGRYVVS